MIEAIFNKIKEQSEKEGYTLSEDAVLFKSLIQNQDSNLFIKDVSFTSIQKVGTYYFSLERSFLQVLLSAK